MDDALGGIGSGSATGECGCTGHARHALGVLARGSALQAASDQQQSAADEDERNLGQAGDERQRRDAAAGEQQGALLAGELCDHVAAHVAIGRGARDDKAGGHGEHEGRNLGDESVTDGEQAVVGDGGGEVQAALEDADGHAADEVDDRDDDGGDCVALDELRATVHGSVEVGLRGDLLAAAACFVVVDEPGVEVCVDGHLLAGHRVQGEAGADFGHALSTLGDDHELDDDQDQEDDQADDDRAADDEVAECLDHRAGIAVDQHLAGDADVEAEPEQGQDEKQGGEGREIQGAADEHRREEHRQGRGHVQGDQDVEDDRGQRHDHHDDDADDRDWYRELADSKLTHGRP